MARKQTNQPDVEISEIIASIWKKRKDRYSHERLEALLASIYDLRQHKKIEMITLGG